MKYSESTELILLPSPSATRRRMAFVWPDADDAIKFGKDFAVGGAAAVIAKTIVAPIERIKLILQVSSVLGLSYVSRSGYSYVLT